MPGVGVVLTFMCWSYFLFVRQVVLEESKTEVLCCNCFWHFVPKLREMLRGRALHWWNVKNKTSCLSVARLPPLLLCSGWPAFVLPFDAVFSVS